MIFAAFCVGQTACGSQCPSGYECPGRSNATECSKGFYSALGVSTCAQCNDGYYAASVGENSAFAVIMSLLLSVLQLFDV